MSELNEFSRAELLLGKEGIEKLRKARVAVFGIGGDRFLCGMRHWQEAAWDTLPLWMEMW